MIVSMLLLLWKSVAVSYPNIRWVIYFTPL
nr:MAG TPA: hypothetical protein [Caudoviricetes sp.]